MWKDIFKVALFILIVALGGFIGALVGGLFGSLTGMDLVNECSNCDDIVIHGLRGYESLGYLGNIVGKQLGLVFGLIIATLILVIILMKKSK